jgi:hypothetical protein
VGGSVSPAALEAMQQPAVGQKRQSLGRHRRAAGIPALCGPRSYADQLSCWIYNGRESCDIEGLGNRVVVRIIIM